MVIVLLIAEMLRRMSNSSYGISIMLKHGTLKGEFLYDRNPAFRLLSCDRREVTW